MVNYQNLRELLTIKEVCQILNVHPNTLRNWDRVGQLRATRIGRRKDRRYVKDEVLKIYRNGSLKMA